MSGQAHVYFITKLLGAQGAPEQLIGHENVTRLSRRFTPRLYFNRADLVRALPGQFAIITVNDPRLAWIMAAYRLDFPNGVPRARLVYERAAGSGQGRWVGGTRQG